VARGTIVACKNPMCKDGLVEKQGMHLGQGAWITRLEPCEECGPCDDMPCPLCGGEVVEIKMKKCCLKCRVVVESCCE